MPNPVTVTFLGGLGEIGRNCAAIEVEVREDPSAHPAATVDRLRNRY